ncbi:tRNA methyltransferase [Anopheles sinensis]|uniref:tRNA (guanine(9)-N(1))-methyltransferase n=1 Tax=Anopheles sinensis TaxID=74873 RepID=A0A084VQ64_ANOSI|nr:tRNA methyltransferase [Anopheles sinensis]
MENHSYQTRLNRPWTEPVKVIVDLSLEAQMDKKEADACVQMCGRIYSVNKGSEKPLRLHFTSFRMNSALLNELWRIETRQLHADFNTEHFSTLFEPERLIYLTNESNNVIDTLEPNHIYIIGGMDDHYKHGKTFLRVAEEFGIRHARLPIFSTVILNNHGFLRMDNVFEMLLLFNAGKTWRQTLMKFVPDLDATAVDAAECFKQLCRVDELNKGVAKTNPLLLHFSGIRGAVKDRIMRDIEGLDWAVKYSTEQFMEQYEPEKLIILTNESENVVDKLELNHAYVIAGLPDQLPHGKRFLQLAIRLGIRHARLPLGDVNKNTLITIDRMFQILLNIYAGKALEQTPMDVQSSTSTAGTSKQYQKIIRLQ